MIFDVLFENSVYTLMLSVYKRQATQLKLTNRTSQICFSLPKPEKLSYADQEVADLAE